jgi:hypothetical protein
VRRNCSPSGWPTAEFISVSAGKACPTSEKADEKKFSHGFSPSVSALLSTFSIPLIMAS